MDFHLMALAPARTKGVRDCLLDCLLLYFQNWARHVGHCIALHVFVFGCISFCLLSLLLINPDRSQLALELTYIHTTTVYDLSLHPLLLYSHASCSYLRSQSIPRLQLHYRYSRLVSALPFLSFPFFTEPTNRRPRIYTSDQACPTHHSFCPSLLVPSAPGSSYSTLFFFLESSHASYHRLFPASRIHRSVP